MALCAWFPLTGTLDNQGTDNVSFTTTNASFQNDGKLGKCLKLGYSSNFTVPSLVNAKQISIAYWLKVNTATSTQWLDPIHYFTNSGSSDWTTRQELYSNCTLTGFWFDNGSIVSIPITVGQWAHFAITVDYEAGIAKVYKDGVLQGTSASVTKTTQVTGNNFRIGENGLDLSENDVRIYNHILSPKEVETLARGLVLHYPMTGGGRGQDNLYDFESVASKWKVTTGAELTLVDATDDVYGNVLKITSPSSVSSERIYRGVNNVWKADTNFTVSFLAKASKTTVLKIERGRTDYAPDVTVGTTWKRYSTVIPCSATTTGGVLGIQPSTASADIYLTQIKVELGDKATAYCPGVGDSHYNSMGYNDNTEYDTSGYLHNGTINGSVSYSSDTPRYSVSTVFANANSNYISLGSKTFDMTSVTFSAWFKVKTAQTWSRIFDFGASEGAGYCIGLATGSNGTTLTVWGRLGSVSSYLPDKQIQTISLNTWYHAVITISGTTCSCYVNGQLVVSFSINSAFPSATTFNYIYFGKSVFSADKYLDGNISDFRMYATALSAEDIQKLYNTAVSLSNNGTLMGYELIEN